MSGGLAKACVPGKNCSVPEKLEFLICYVVFHYLADISSTTHDLI